MCVPVGKVVVGGTYYFLFHAYHHVIATVEEIVGKRMVVTGPQAWVYSSQLDWTQFFKQGPSNGNSVIRGFPPGEFEYISAWRWDHPVPPPSQR